MRELSYVTPTDPAWKRWLTATIEDVSGRRKILPYYLKWRREYVGRSQTMMRDGLDLIDVDLNIRSVAPWPPKISDGLPLVMIANHPFGIGDGVAALSLAEELGRPFRVLINNDLMRIPEVRPYALPIDFSETREAVDMNLRSRAEARRLLREGVTIIVFPAGGVATAHNPFGKAEELPWKTFTARLVQLAEASVLPVFFEGQNSVLFHAVSRLSLTLRLSLLVSEFRYMPGSTFNVHVGGVTPFAAIPNRTNRMELTRELYLLVRRLDPDAAGKSDAELEPTPPDKRPAYPWD
ncbi:MAG: 1-acyl-sn-glycerol-3-phosphate acyltransferase [Alphaproteobacteria bacterium]|nr:1-acyl-sn-glycerol-3-phosphate acyltransferase [Alphaproteobacteria bacterium]